MFLLKNFILFGVFLAILNYCFKSFTSLSFKISYIAIFCTNFFVKKIINYSVLIFRIIQRST